MLFNCSGKKSNFRTGLKKIMAVRNVTQCCRTAALKMVCGWWIQWKRRVDWQLVMYWSTWCFDYAGLSRAPEQSAIALEKQEKSHPANAQKETYHPFRVTSSLSLPSPATSVACISKTHFWGRKYLDDIAQLWRFQWVRSTRLRLAVWVKHL